MAIAPEHLKTGSVSTSWKSIFRSFLGKKKEEKKRKKTKKGTKTAEILPKLFRLLLLLGEEDRVGGMEVLRIEGAKVLGCRPDDLRRKDETTTPLNVLIRTLDKKEFGLQVLWFWTNLSPSFRAL